MNGSGFRSYFWRSIVLLFSVLWLTACSGGADPKGPETGIIRLSVSAVPADVACFRLTVANAAVTRVRNLSATPGQPLTATLSGLPVGDVSISAEAFSAACPANGALAGWVSDPLTATLVAGVPLPVHLTMRRNGRIDLSVDWEDDSGAPNLMFVTSQQFNGNMGGLEGADARCQLMAQTAGLPGTFIAFAQSSTVSLASRIEGARGWVRTDGRPFADTAEDVLAGRILYPPVLDEFGNVTISTVAVGDPGGSGTCNDWTSTAVSDIFTGGWTSLSGQSFYFGAATSCLAPFRLYCFEVARSVAVEAVAPVPHRVAFLSKHPFAPSGGIANADIECGVDAVQAGLPGSFRALLATPSASAISRFDVTGPPWAKLSGVLIAPTAADLATDILSHIDVRADGTHAAAADSPDMVSDFGPGAWTGADRLDTPSTPADSCQNWTSSSASFEGLALRVANSAPSWQAGGDNWSTGSFDCTTGAHLFCLER